MRLSLLLLFLSAFGLFGQYLPMKQLHPTSSTPEESLVLIESDSAYRAYFSESRSSELPNIDFDRELLIGVSVFVDCNAQMYYQLYTNSDSMTFHLLVSDCYGGCAGMTRKGGWFVFKKLPKNYDLKVAAADRNPTDILKIERYTSQSAVAESWEIFDCSVLWTSGIVSKEVYDALDLSLELNAYQVAYAKRQLLGEWKLQSVPAEESLTTSRSIFFTIDSTGIGSYGELMDSTVKRKTIGKFWIEVTSQTTLIHCDSKSWWGSEQARIGFHNEEFRIWPTDESGELIKQGFYRYKRLN